MNIVFASTSDDPLYQQIYEQVRAQIIKGELPSGYCLPPIRTVALGLRISVITVKKAWEELERGGYIRTMVGRGCFVAPLPAGELDVKRNQLAREKLLKDIEYYKAIGLTKADILQLVDDLFSS
jgi:GntR family transcriptional regulator